MIVVVGHAALLTGSSDAGRAAGLAPAIAAAAAAAGSAAELVSRIGDDGAGEELLLALGRAGVGHLAVLRDPARPTVLVDVPAGDLLDDDLPLAALADVSAAVEAESSPVAQRPGPAAAPPVAQRPAAAAPSLEPADLALGLAYLRDYRVVVAVEPLAPGAAEVVAEAARFAGATLVVVAAPGAAVATPYGAATVFEAPADDPDGAFATLAGRYAAALDGGATADDAFRAATTAGGWERAGG